MADTFELRAETATAAQKVTQTMNKNPKKFALVTVGTGGGKTYISIHSVGRFIKEAHLFVITTKKKVLEDDWQASIKSYNKVMKTNFTFTVINYERIRVKKRYEELIDELHEYTDRSRKPVIIILDEAHLIKNAKGYQFKAVQKLQNDPTTNGVIALTATPISNSYIDAVSYLILAGYYESYNQFERAHVRFKDKFFNPVVRNRSGEIDRNLFVDPDLIDTYLKNMNVSIDTAQLLPDVSFKDFFFTLSKEEMVEYNQIKKDYRAGLYESQQTAIAAMRQYVALHSQVKFQKMKQILDSPHITKPVLIFYQYNAELASLRAFFETYEPKFDVIEINGHSKVTSEHLKNPKNQRTVFLIQYKSGSAALDAKFSNVSIFFTPAHSYQDHKQAIGRNVRAYQKVDRVWQFRFIVDKTVTN
jgi:superfamily II DNA or RNA helicase